VILKSEGISIFFPAYNDENTIRPLVEGAVSLLKALAVDYEIIIIDDHSQDKTGEVADRLALENQRVKVVHHDQNRGYGGALKSGFACASKELIFYTDGDAQYDIQELKLLLPHIRDADVVNGYKIKRKDPLIRIITGKAYNLTVNALFGISIRDVNCDFRFIRKKVFDLISLESESGFICVELIKKIQLKGFKIKEVAVHHYPRKYGRSQFLRPGKLMRMSKDLLQQWWKLVIKGSKT
jgi:glycosyltransferase involved in cell wall biosynthesis